MATEILMPALSPTMSEGTLAKWHVKEGDEVKAGDVLAEIETDKATMEFEAVDEGIVGRILVAEGTEGVAVNQPIATMVDEGEDVPAESPSKPPAADDPDASGTISKEAEEAKPAPAKAEESGAKAAAPATVRPPAEEE